MFYYLRYQGYLGQYFQEKHVGKLAAEVELSSFLGDCKLLTEKLPCSEPKYLEENDKLKKRGKEIVFKIK